MVWFGMDMALRGGRRGLRSFAQRPRKRARSSGSRRRAGRTEHSGRVRLTAPRAPAAGARAPTLGGAGRSGDGGRGAGGAHSGFRTRRPGLRPCGAERGREAARDASDLGASSLLGQLQSAAAQARTWAPGTARGTSATSRRYRERVFGATAAYEAGAAAEAAATPLRWRVRTGMATGAETQIEGAVPRMMAPPRMGACA